MPTFSQAGPLWGGFPPADPTLMEQVKKFNQEHVSP